MVQTKKNSYLLLGASRGLGNAFFRRLHELKLDSDITTFSRKAKDFEEGWGNELKVKAHSHNNVNFENFDFSRSQDQDKVLSWIKKNEPTHIFYFAAGGPFGKFEEKNWASHQWAFEVSFLFPAKLVHFSLNQPFLKQIILIGSSVAESSPDPMASSYCASKHAILGLFQSLKKENLNLDLRLFSPTYMDTDMLPKKAWPRKSEKILNPYEVAQFLWDWSNKDAEFGSHLRYT